MFGVVRAAGYAAAAIGAALAPALANPLMAWEVEASPITVRYTDHVGATIDSPVPEENGLETPGLLAGRFLFSKHFSLLCYRIDHLGYSSSHFSSGLATLERF